MKIVDVHGRDGTERTLIIGSLGLAKYSLHFPQW